MKIVKFLFSPLFMGVLFILFAVSMAVATFIENDFGSSAAYGIVYDTKWFELIMLLLAVNLAGQIFEFRLYRREKFTMFLFHSAFIVILAGAGITRYFGHEGSIHIREGEEENSYYSTDRYLGFTVRDPSGKILAEEVNEINLNARSSENFTQTIHAAGKKYTITLARIIANARESIAESPSGVPVVSLISATGQGGMENILLSKGESARLSGYTVGFESPDPSDIRISSDGQVFFISSGTVFSEQGMMHGDSIAYKEGSKAELKTMRIYSFGSLRLIPQQMTMSGIVRAVSADPSEEETGMDALVFHVLDGGKPVSATLWTRDHEYVSQVNTAVGENSLDIFYGSRVYTLPFSLKLNDFILERYPGSSSPSGYKSDVLLLDRAEGTEKPFMIYMNNILKYKGYRFYQSSFDRDERGTILSVNHDTAGMTVTYTGYAIMIIFIILSLFNRNSIFRNIRPDSWSSPFRKMAAMTALLVVSAVTGSLFAQELIPDRRVSDEIGRLLVQDQKGRTKPIYTLSNDILRKVTRENDFKGLSSMQVFLGINLDFANWQDIKLIRVSNADLQKKIGIRGNMAAFSDIVDLAAGGSYKLSEDVRKAYEKAPGERNKYDKELMKVDERVNIVYMIYTGQFLKMFPLKSENHEWGTSEEAVKSAVSREDSLYLGNVLKLLSDAVVENNYSNAAGIVGSIAEYQSRFSEYDLPSPAKRNAEIFYYRAMIFERLFPFYGTVGLIMLIILVGQVIKGWKERSLVIKILGWILFTGFLIHTFGLGLRWFVSGHSPMSNGYESMLFISWVTLLAGLFFGRKTPFALSATAVLGSLTLMVAHLSFMDPEITNLVPVLKSYWLTLHVSVITGSYGFLGLGAILGLIVMILLMLVPDRNLARTGITIEELTIINYRALTLGLYLLTIGTFLGAIWANESWGRYWGWDPKETWSLITIVIYSFVIHSRLIKGLKDIYTFNFMALFAFSSVLMTYFGVNYYLSGLHSYAGGDPVPVPVFVYIAVIALGAVCFLAYARYSSLKRKTEIIKEK